MENTKDTREPRQRAVQIKGAWNDPLLVRLESFAKKRGIAVATVARMLIKEGLDKAGEK